jgi:ABC-2 type transport system ATP-binding protein
VILVSSQHIEEIAKLFEEVIIIDEGRVLLHESAETLRGRGMTVTGPAATVDKLASGSTILSERSLGSTKSVAIYDATEQLAQQAKAAGLETSLLPIQDIFVHLTAKHGKH